MRPSRPSGRRAAAILALAWGATACAPARPPAAAATTAKTYEAPEERFVFFANGRSEVLPDGFFAVGYVAAMLDADPRMHVLIVGHADLHGKNDFNKDLSFRRARVVRKVLLDHGIKESRILVAAPRETDEKTLATLSRRVDLFVYDPLQDEASTRLGYAVEVKEE